MDVNRGHLVADINTIPDAMRERYTPVPGSLEDEARRELAGRREAYINPNRAVALAAWAAKQRKKNRARTKLQRTSRARNRRTR